MPPRAKLQTTLDTAFGVKLKRSAPEVVAATGSVPAKKRRKVSERCVPTAYIPWKLLKHGII
jgi:hypothetical protein